MGDVRRKNKKPNSQECTAEQEPDEVCKIWDRRRRRGSFGHDVSNARPISRQDVVLVLPELPFPFLTGFLSSVHRRKVFLRPATCDLTSEVKKADPHRRADGPRMNPRLSVGNPPRPFRLFRMTERSTPDPSSSRVPVHSALVQKSVTTSTNLAGRLSSSDARKLPRDSQEEKQK
jgi:hypothetical protein